MSKNAVTMLGLGLLILTLSSTLWIAGQASESTEADDSQPIAHASRPFEAKTVAELSRTFKKFDYAWPPSAPSGVPPLALQQLPQDFADISDAEQRKSLFLRAVLPIVLMENRRLQEQRDLATLLLKHRFPPVDSAPYHWLVDLAKELRVKGDLHQDRVQATLLRRLDQIPPALALAQAAIESGWGSSRFALEGNSLFGQWTFDGESGLEPNQRDAEANHFVAHFPNLRASVRAYMRNLNTNRAYREFRDARAALRRAQQPLSPTELAGHLQRYSQRGKDYVRELRRIINGRTLAMLPEMPAKDSTPAAILAAWFALPAASDS
jgi:Bax protein